MIDIDKYNIKYENMINISILNICRTTIEIQILCWSLHYWNSTKRDGTFICNV